MNNLKIKKMGKPQRQIVLTPTVQDGDIYDILASMQVADVPNNPTHIALDIVGEFNEQWFYTTLVDENKNLQAWGFQWIRSSDTAFLILDRLPKGKLYYFAFRRAGNWLSIDFNPMIYVPIQL